MHSAMLSMEGSSETMVFIPAALAARLVSSPMQTAVNPESPSASGFKRFKNPSTVDALVKVTKEKSCFFKSSFTLSACGEASGRTVS